MDSKNTPASMQSSGGTKISRRTVARGVAWSAPIVAVGVAAPAFAASCTPQITLGPGSCKCPGQSTKQEPWIYYLEFCITDANDCALSAGTRFTVTAVETNEDLGSGANNCFQGLPASGTVGTGGCTPVIRLTSTNSANHLDVTFTVGTGPTAQTFTTRNIDAPPNCSDVSGLERRCEACTA